MHLLAVQKGTLADEGEAVDLGQSPARICVLSAADTEVAVLAAARAVRGDGPDFLRLVNFLQLKHPMSVDQWIERTGRHARLIVVRALGGEGYWPYGLEALHAAAVQHGITLAVLPGDDKADAGLARFCTLEKAQCEALWRCLIEGGVDNAAAFLSIADALTGGVDEPTLPKPLLKAGLFSAGKADAGLDALRTDWIDGAPVAAIVFYRALVQSGQTAAIQALADALKARGMNVLPVFVTSLKDPVSAATVSALFDTTRLDVVLNATGFAVSTSGGDWQGTVLDRQGALVLQVVLSSSSEEAWAQSAFGLSSRDLAMNIALPELDGRVFARAVSFKAASDFDEFVQAAIVRHAPLADRVAFTADLAAKWVRLKRKSAAERNVAIVLANYPNRDGRIANGVGLDTPAGTIEVMRAMAESGYQLDSIPVDGDALVRALQAGVTNAAAEGRAVRETLSLSDYRWLFGKLPEVIQTQIRERWGEPESDPFWFENIQAFALPLMRFGKVIVGIQPARGYNIDPKQSYHSPDLVPPHGYFAFYFFLRETFGADAVIHMGKHGNMEWLPGKSLGLSSACYPEAVFGPMPHLYPFIVNDPGEGTQAKRRASAVIIDHLTPPLTRAESHGALKDLEALVDEYYQAQGADPRRVKLIGPRILALVRDIGLDADAGISKADDEGRSLEKLDAYLCDLKEMQIRDGLHIFGRAPEGRLLTDLTVALARLPRRQGQGGDQSLHRAIAADSFDGVTQTFVFVGHRPDDPDLPPRSLPKKLGRRDKPDDDEQGVASKIISATGGRMEFDPLDCDMAEPWLGVKSEILRSVSVDPWRTNGDTVERIELLAARLVDGSVVCPEGWGATRQVLEAIAGSIRPSVEQCGNAEIDGLLKGLDGRFVPPGPSGAPTRGRPDVLPTGRNFYSVDTRAVPTETAWELGKKSAEMLCLRHLQDHGDHLQAAGITAWGTSNMRTGGDDIAQAMALIGAKPVWERASGRVTGFEIIPLAMLGRPRVDVTLRISGFFRDAFPDQIGLFDRAARAVGGLDEDAGDNPLAERMKAEASALIAGGMDERQAEQAAGYRVFGSMPGAYGAGLQALIDEKGWTERRELAEAYMTWGAFAYGAGQEGVADRDGFEARLSKLEAVVQNQDNREHDILDSDDYYQFEGGMTAAVEALSGRLPVVYHNDHSRPEKPVVRTLEEEIGRVVRARVINPKWIAGVMRHGYKGAFEIAATVDYMFAFAATTGAVKNHHFDAVYQAFIADEAVRDFMAGANPHALKEMTERLLEALERGLWTAKSNSAKFELERLAAAPKVNPERMPNV
ncbi:MAG: cobaltochelatase subunit CobN [Rhizobiaceae bacterium]